MRNHAVFRPGDIELRCDADQSLQSKRLHWAIWVKLSVRGVLLECEARFFVQTLDPQGSNLAQSKTFVLLNTSESHAGQRINALETQTFDARSGDEDALEPTLVGSGPVDYYRVTGLSKTLDGEIVLQAPAVIVVFRTVSLTLEL